MFRIQFQGGPLDGARFSSPVNLVTLVGATVGGTEFAYEADWEEDRRAGILVNMCFTDPKELENEDDK